jgi:hypothetical protein
MRMRSNKVPLDQLGVLVLICLLYSDSLYVCSLLRLGLYFWSTIPLCPVQRVWHTDGTVLEFILSFIPIWSIT